jgi:hypothetical protein
MSLQRNKFYLLLILSCLAGFLWLLISGISRVNSSHDLSICMFKHITNIPCPSCGSTRSALSLLKGNISEALFWNPIGIILVFFLVTAPPWISYDLLKNKDTLFNTYKKAEIFIRRREVAILSILLIAANWLWNIYKGL